MERTKQLVLSVIKTSFARKDTPQSKHQDKTAATSVFQPPLEDLSSISSGGFALPDMSELPGSYATSLDPYKEPFNDFPLDLPERPRRQSKFAFKKPQKTSLPETTISGSPFYSVTPPISPKASHNRVIRPAHYPIPTHDDNSAVMTPPPSPEFKNATSQTPLTADCASRSNKSQQSPAPPYPTNNFPPIGSLSISRKPLPHGVDIVPAGSNSTLPVEPSYPLHDPLVKRLAKLRATSGAPTTAGAPTTTSLNNSRSLHASNLIPRSGPEDIPNQMREDPDIVTVSRSSRRRHSSRSPRTHSGTSLSNKDRQSSVSTSMWNLKQSDNDEASPKLHETNPYRRTSRSTVQHKSRTSKNAVQKHDQGRNVNAAVLQEERDRRLAEKLQLEVRGFPVRIRSNTNTNHLSRIYRRRKIIMTFWP
jgi:hypothetical protein